MDAGGKLERTIEEYRSSFVEIMQNKCSKQGVLWELVETRLSCVNGWTVEGAGEVARLAREYGTFMLRNALAVANILEIEDGELGY